MKRNELKALISLLDDPDNEIFHQIETQLLSVGPEAVSLLEDYYTSSFDPFIQTRVENIIQKIQFDTTKNDLQLWLLQNKEDLLQGLLIINRYQHPNLDENKIRLQLSELRTQIWIQLIYDMSPIEKVNLLNNVIFNEFGLSGNTSDYHDPQNSFISSVLETKKGNPISLACIYSILAQQLDIPIYGINLPKHFIAAYVEDMNQVPLFYINVFNKGQIMKHEDIHSFLTQLQLPPKSDYILPCENIEIIKRVVRNLMTAFENVGNARKKDEMVAILRLLNDHD